jgi:outer membrane protein, multidrug efflux system
MSLCASSDAKPVSWSGARPTCGTIGVGWDAELNSLVERSASRNLDLKLALERAQEARAARGVARSGYFPSIDGAASGTRNRQRVIAPVGPQNSPIIAPVEYNNFQGGLSASWECDPLGRRRRVYAQLRGFQRRLEIANKNIKTQQDTLDLTSARAKAGLATELDVSRAAAQLESTKAVVPSLLGGIDVSIHRLSVLLGEQPGLLRSELEKTIRFRQLDRRSMSVCLQISWRGVPIFAAARRNWPPRQLGSVRQRRIYFLASYSPARPDVRPLNFTTSR